MADDRPEEHGPLPDSDRPRRAPPTIDLEATEVSSETPKASERGAACTPETAPPSQRPKRPRPEPVSEAEPRGPSDVAADLTLGRLRRSPARSLPRS